MPSFLKPLRAAIPAALAVLCSLPPAASALTLTSNDCGACHVGSNLDRHHRLISEAGMECLACHQLHDLPAGGYTILLSRECLACHNATVHNGVSHTVTTPADCARCHRESLETTHAENGWHGGDPAINAEIFPCLRCHTSTSTSIIETISAGLAGETPSCMNCHPYGMKRSRGTSSVRR
ncbi:cytochrome C [Geobacter sulfurreducens]|jgi:hypothetical protein|uniref:Cytochrome c n=1 Tax=Geobacter sulfurreducens (strain ATCC 51573 / DSM 12127 / PCA) TaxID=243231 RepID=Q74AQ8_GEOSL|nr:cytochrome c3 family protein [Geobacter sulfurreducens]AAR35670.1 cytochrome c [Geobacter sulfurreducens PCA]ADI85054.1 cytochrome c, 6 heme-binding sites [Geobacter sulfurreducens KN400]AJY68523.1 cytochrome C [Geobacter sulfurreducens]QVW34145.1 cytochrome C [Geobacter sulfurreducens]UAC03005.1 cytochrome C [Geobacter sulfurreducens]